MNISDLSGQNSIGETELDNGLRSVSIVEDTAHRKA